MDPSSITIQNNSSKELVKTPLRDKPLANDHFWQGRRVYEGKDAKWPQRAAIAAIASIAIGAMAVIFSHPILGGLLVAGGACLLLKAYHSYQSPNQLKIALQHLVNSDLGALPQRRWSEKQRGFWTILEAWKPKHMSGNIMVLKEKGEPFAVAFNYLNPNLKQYGKAPNAVIVYDFNQRFSPSQTGDNSFKVRHSLSAEEGAKLAQFLSFNSRG